MRLVDGNDQWTLVVILGSLFLGLYLLRVGFAFLVVGVTVAAAQLYAELDEFSNHLLSIRLVETAIGAVIAAVTVLLVVPLRSRRVLRVALEGYLTALLALVEAAGDRLVAAATTGGDSARGAIPTRARALDAAYQALLTCAGSAGSLPVGPRACRRARSPPKQRACATTPGRSSPRPMRPAASTRTAAPLSHAPTHACWRRSEG